MRELKEHELKIVNGGSHGLTPAEGGLALIGVGLTALSGPVGLGVFAISAGTTMLAGEAYFGNHNNS